MGLERLVVHDGQRRGRGADAARAQSRSRGGWRAGPVGTAAVAHKRKRASVRMGWPGGEGKWADPRRTVLLQNYSKKFKPI
jgi:hypothetical protein